MVQRLTYRKRHSYSTKSNQNRVIKTPGGELVYQTLKKRANEPKCPVTWKRIHGIPHLRPTEVQEVKIIHKPQDCKSSIWWSSVWWCCEGKD
ncbi:hypothetical protein QQ045_029858 [Rhodiola kirilowii]